jgi:hypothetical protein
MTPETHTKIVQCPSKLEGIKFNYLRSSRNSKTCLRVADFLKDTVIPVVPESQEKQLRELIKLRARFLNMAGAQDKIKFQARSKKAMYDLRKVIRSAVAS